VAQVVERCLASMKPWVQTHYCQNKQTKKKWERNSNLLF
jgi:hypothetical protein